MLSGLKIAQVIDKLEAGGAERVLVSLSNILQEHNHEVKVITTVNPGPLALQLNEGIEQVCLYRKWKYNPVTMYKLVKQLRDCNVVHVHSYYNLLYLFTAKTLFGLRGRIFFHEHYGARTGEKTGLFKSYMLRKIIFIGVSEKLCKWAIETAGAPKKKVFLLPNIIQKQNLNAVQMRDKTFVQLLIVSNILPNKNIEFSIKLCKQLQQSGRKIKLTIIGKWADENYYAVLIKQIADASMAEDVIFIHDCVNVQPKLHEYDLALHTSFSESGPLVLMEYMAQGLPFIAYNTGEVAAQLQHDLPECFINNFETQPWLQTIQLLLNKDREEFSASLKKVFDIYFSEEAYYNKCMEIYKAGLAEYVTKDQ